MDLQTPILEQPTSEAPWVDGDQPAATESTARKRRGSGRTEAGKDRSKRNSLKHGLMANQVFPEHLALAIGKLDDELKDQFQPKTPYESRLVGDMAKNWAKIDYIEELKKLDIQRVRDQATLSWDTDQRENADKLGERLAKTPAKVSLALERSKQGVDWKLDRFEGLAEVLETNAVLDEAQLELLFDLIGVPVALRNGSRQVPAMTDGPALAALVAKEIVRLEALLDEKLFALDEARQAMAMAGIPYEQDAPTKALRKLERAAQRGLDRARDELKEVQAAAAVAAKEKKWREIEATLQGSPIGDLPDVVPPTKATDPAAAPSVADLLEHTTDASQAETLVATEVVDFAVSKPVIAATSEPTILLTSGQNRPTGKALKKLLRKSAQHTARQGSR